MKLRNRRCFVWPRQHRSSLSTNKTGANDLLFHHGSLWEPLKAVSFPCMSQASPQGSVQILSGDLAETAWTTSGNIRFCAHFGKLSCRPKAGKKTGSFVVEGIEIPCICHLEILLFPYICRWAYMQQREQGVLFPEPGTCVKTAFCSSFLQLFRITKDCQQCPSFAECSKRCLQKGRNKKHFWSKMLEL